VDKRILETICSLQNKGQKTALITIMAARGSTPRKTGTQMLILPDGTTWGTIGGGCCEADVKRRAFTALDDNQSCKCTISMLNEAAADEGMVCGGIMDVFIQVI
jgi:xanthine dehydrogenase accessory factor